MLSTPVTTLSQESIERFRNWCSARGRSFNTTKGYCSDLNQFLKAIGEDSIPMEEFEELAMSWLNLTRYQMEPKTTGRRLTSLRAFGKWAGLTNPLSDYIAPTPGRAIPHPLPEGPDGMRKMIRKAKNNQQAALVGLCGFVGTRIGEALAIKPDNFDLHEMTLTVRGKGDRTRTVPVSDEAWGAVSSAYVLALTQGEPLIQYKDRFARKIITNLGVRAGLSRPVSSHDLRATFATAALNKTGNLRVVQELLGHASSATTEVYTGVMMHQMREAVQL